MASPPPGTPGPFLPPAFFAPSYFAPGGIVLGTSPAFFAPGYFAAGFFAPGYFANTAATVAGVEVVLPTDQAALLDAVRRMLIDGGVGTETTVVVSLTPDMALTTGNQMILCPEGFASVGEDFDGAGRKLTTMEGSFTVDVVTLSQRDQGNRDLKRLTAQSGNVLLDAHRVVDCLQERFVVDDKGNHLSTEPMMILDQSKPRRYGTGQSHAGVELAFSVGYIARMS